MRTMILSMMVTCAGLGLNACTHKDPAHGSDLQTRPPSEGTRSTGLTALSMHCLGQITTAEWNELDLSADQLRRVQALQQRVGPGSSRGSTTGGTGSSQGTSGGTSPEGGAQDPAETTGRAAGGGYNSGTAAGGSDQGTTGQDRSGQYRNTTADLDEPTFQELSTILDTDQLSRLARRCEKGRMEP